MAESIIKNSLANKIQHNNHGDVVGYYARRTYEASELNNVTQGSITVVNSNGVCCIKLTNFVCTPDVSIIDLSAYVGSNAYAYDSDGGSGMFIDAGRLYCKEANMGYRVFTFVL